MVLRSFLSYCRRNPQLLAGLFLVLILLAIGVVGPHFVDIRNAAPTSAIPDQPPGPDTPLGSDDQGRDMLAVLVAGVPLTLRVGFIAGAVGVIIGIILGFVSGYLGGPLDTGVRMVVDTLLTVPGLLVLIIIANSIKGVIDITLMALVVASLAWMHPTRTIRAQVLSFRERAYVQMARLSGMSGLEIIVRELIPNLLPYLAASVRGSGGGRRAGVDRARSARPGSPERAHDRHDDLLGDLVQRASARHVVVVGSADRRPGGALHRHCS